MTKFAKYVKTENIRKTRKEKGITVRELQEALGFNSPSSYYYLESGFVEPRISQMAILSQVLDEPASNFFAL